VREEKNRGDTQSMTNLEFDQNKSSFTQTLKALGLHPALLALSAVPAGGRTPSLEVSAQVAALSGWK